MPHLLPVAHDDIYAVKRLIAAYCDAVKRLDANAAGNLFCPDAALKIADYPLLEGKEAITSGMRQTFSQFSFMHQRCDTGLIDIDNDCGFARLDVFEANNPLGKEGIQLIFGTYEDEYRHLEQGWRFYRRRFTLQARSMVPATKFQAFAPASISHSFEI